MERFSFDDDELYPHDIRNNGAYWWSLSLWWLIPYSGQKLHEPSSRQLKNGKRTVFVVIHFRSDGRGILYRVQTGQSAKSMSYIRAMCGWCP